MNGTNLCRFPSFDSRQISKSFSEHGDFSVPYICRRSFVFHKKTGQYLLLLCYHGICRVLGHWYLPKLSIHLFFFSFLKNRLYGFVHHDIQFFKLSIKDYSHILNNMAKPRELILLSQINDSRDIDCKFKSFEYSFKESLIYTWYNLLTLLSAAPHINAASNKCYTNGT